MRRKLGTVLAHATASLMGSMGCGDEETPTPDYGVPAEDGDGDGWYPGEDCDDGDAAIHPEADELCDDGLDNDCDGNVDADDVDCEEPAPPTRAGLSKEAAKLLGLWAGDTGGSVTDYSGWAPE